MRQHEKKKKSRAEEIARTGNHSYLGGLKEGLRGVRLEKEAGACQLMSG